MLRIAGFTRMQQVRKAATTETGITKGLDTKIHMSVDTHGILVRVIVTTAATADCKQACALIDRMEAEKLLADKGYDTQEVIDAALYGNMEIVIPPKRNRKERRVYDRYLYRPHHLVENAFLYLDRVVN